MVKNLVPDKVVETYKKVRFFKNLLESVIESPNKYAFVIGNAIETLVKVEDTIKQLELIERELLEKYPELENMEV